MFSLPKALRGYLLLSVILGLLVVGCGNSAPSPVGVSGQPNSLGGTDQVYGRVLLERPADGAIVELTDLSGSSLGYAPAEVDYSGNFRIAVNAAALPEEFRVRVNLGAGSRWNLPIVANVTRDAVDRPAFCNFLTTAAAVYRERKGVSQEQAVAWVKRVFAIPAEADIGYGVDESRRSYFRHSVLLQSAGAEVAGYLSQLIDRDEIKGQFGEAILVSVVADLATDAIGKVFGTLAQALGLNIGPASEVKELADDLSTIQQELVTLEAQLQADLTTLRNEEIAAGLLESYTSLTAELEPVLSEIDARTLDLVTTVYNSSVTNIPRLPDSQLTNLLSNLAAYNAETSLGQIAAVLLGQNQTVSLLGLYKEMLGYQALSNSRTYDPFERFFLYYTQHQTLALNLLVENANLSQDPAIVAEARAAGTQAQAALVEESQYLGLPQASDLFLSYPGAAFQPRQYRPTPATPSGWTFYTQLQAPTPAYDSNGDVSDFLTRTEQFAAPGPGNGTGWRLPSLDELGQLRMLALQENPESAIAGLRELGFATPPDWDGTMWYKNLESASGLSLDSYDFETGQSSPSNGAAEQHGYLQVRYASFDASQQYRQLVPAGFRPVQAPVLELSADGRKVTAKYSQGSEDVSPFIIWSSSNPAQLEVGIGPRAGVLTWHFSAGPLRAQTITARWQGMDASTAALRDYSATLEVDPPPTTAPTLTALVIKPGNVVFLPPLRNTLFTATGYYDDGTLADLTQQVTWSLELPNGFPYPRLEATITGSIPGLLVFISPLIVDPDITVKATLGSVVGQTRVKIATP